VTVPSSQERKGPPHADWLSRVETLGTTVVVLMIGGMVLWFKAADHEPRLIVVIAVALIVYAAALVAFGRRFRETPAAPWPFLLAGVCAGSIAEAVNAQFLMTREFFAACLTGAAIGLAQWAALRTWLHLAR
jgi:phosphoglycerol transferase MdoB-like AlkP superfamily enzyme